MVKKLSLLLLLQVIFHIFAASKLTAALANSMVLIVKHLADIIDNATKNIVNNDYEVLNEKAIENIIDIFHHADIFGNFNLEIEQDLEAMDHGCFIHQE